MTANAACSEIKLRLCAGLGADGEAVVIVLHHAGLILPTPEVAQPKTTNLQPQALASTEERRLGGDGK